MITTDINIKVSIENDVDLANPKNTDKIKVDISHDNCGNEKLDKFADDLAKVFSYVLDSFHSAMMEEMSQQNQPHAPMVETEIKDQ